MFDEPSFSPMFLFVKPSDYWKYSEQYFPLYHSSSFSAKLFGGYDARPRHIPYQLWLYTERRNEEAKYYGGVLTQQYGIQFAIIAAHCGIPTSFSPVPSEKVRISARELNLMRPTE